MISQRLHRVVASFELCVANGHVDVVVKRTAQSDRPVRIAPLELFLLLFLLRFIFLARERGRRWWRVSRSSPTRLPHSSHLPSALSARFSPLAAIPMIIRAV
jgi:hypothetical protein